MKQDVVPRSGKSVRRRLAWRIALGYALAASAWIIGSDLLVAASTGDSLNTPASIAKGLLFTGVTSVLLYVLLARALETVEGLMFARARSAEARRLDAFSTASVFAIAAILSLVVVGLLMTLDSKVDASAPLGGTLRIPAWLGLLGALVLAAMFVLALVWRLRVRELLKRVAAEDEERELLDEHLDLLSRHANDAILLVDGQGTIVQANERAFERYGYPREELIGMSASLLRIPSERAEASRRITDVEATGSAIYETRHITRDGREFPVEISGRRIVAGDRAYIQVIIRDISLRKQALRELEFKNTILSTQQESSLDGILVVDEAQRIISYNRRFVELWRIPDDLLRAAADEPVLRFATAQIAEPGPFLARIRHLYEHRDERSDDEFNLKDGRILHRHSAPMIAPDGNYLGRVWYFRDVTERRRAEDELRESEERFRAMIEQSISGTCIIDEQGNFAYVNPRLAGILGYESYQPLIGRAVLDFVVPENRELVRENMRRRISGEAQSLRYHFDVVRKDGTRITLGAHGTQGVYRGKPMIVATVQDVTEVRRAEEEVARTVAKLRRAVQSTIEVVSTIGELRDPYTHGHEHRVGEIATAIATEMGLAPDRIEGIRIAGYLHDVGKIAVPAEILAKPSRLSPVEFALVKQHAQQSYEILKGVDFPWPVAEAAWSHHERLDGSGYPRGLKGEEIILEARVLAVADTVEAMASHRPYRPGLGIDKALAEVERGRATVYDPQVVDACLRLFREKNYTLPA